MPSSDYSPRRVAQSHHQDGVRGLRYHLLQWGQPQAGQAPVFMLHGWMDVAASWQFVVDALAQERCIIAPDWRGFGRTHSGQDSFYFPDYLGDLDVLIPAQLQRLGLPADAPVDVVGHSMGAHVAMLYASARPERVARLVNMEGFGGPPNGPEAAPGHYRRWLQSVEALRQGQLDLKPYASQAAVAQRLLKSNPRMAPARAQWLAGQWAEQGEDGQWRILGAAAHKTLNPVLFRTEEARACYAAIACPVLSLLAQHTHLEAWSPGYSIAAYKERLSQIAQHQLQEVADAGHMLHHDQPEAVARALDAFLA